MRRLKAKARQNVEAIPAGFNQGTKKLAKCALRVWPYLCLRPPPLRSPSIFSNSLRKSCSV